MSLPSGVTECVVTLGPFEDHLGAPVRGQVTFTASTMVRHAASGVVLFKRPLVVNLTARGTGVITLPHTNQTGLVDGSGAALTGWTYKVHFSLADRVVNPADFSFGLQVGQSTVALGNLIPIPTSTGTSGVIPAVTSVNGATGAITVASVSALAAVSDVANAAAADVADILAGGGMTGPEGPTGPT